MTLWAMRLFPFKAPDAGARIFSPPAAHALSNPVVPAGNAGPIPSLVIVRVRFVERMAVLAKRILALSLPRFLKWIGLPGVI